MTSYVFDIFGLEFGFPFLTGGKIVLGNINFEKINCSDFDFIQLTPSLSRLIVCRFTNIGNTKFIIGGEPLDSKLARDLLNAGFQIINAYGPTETTIWSTSKLYNTQFLSERSYIGGPLPNEKIYVLNQSLKPVPIGAPGELYIGGQGVARGYLNHPKLTAEKWIDPVQINSQLSADCEFSGRLYKTGDRVRSLLGGGFRIHRKR